MFLKKNEQEQFEERQFNRLRFFAGFDFLMS